MSDDIILQIHQIEKRNERSQLITCGFLLLLGLVLSFSPVVQGPAGSLFWQIAGGVFMLMAAMFALYIYRIFPFHRQSLTHFIHNQPGKIVWIYPYIVENMPFGIKLFNLTTLYFNLLDGNNLQLRCRPQEAYKVMDELKVHLPHACYGYSQEKEFMYENDPKMLLRE